MFKTPLKAATARPFLFEQDLHQELLSNYLTAVHSTGITAAYLGAAHCRSSPYLRCTMPVQHLHFQQLAGMALAGKWQHPH